MAMLWLLNLSDGTNSLLDVAERSGINFQTILAVTALLEEKQLLREI